MKALSSLQAVVVFPAAKALMAFCRVPFRLVLVPAGRLKLSTRLTRFAVCVDGPFTVMEKLPLDELPAASDAVQLTAVVPTGNVLPDAGAHATVGGRPVSSVAVAL